jgi:dihydroorotase
MIMNTILILNARMVNEGRICDGDLLVRSGRIEKIGGDLSGRHADFIIDAAGKALLPGMIDDQVHFREPGLTHKGDIATESRAAVAGGITSFMDMPNTAPPTISRQRLQEKYELAGGRSFANYSFYLGAANDNLEEIRALDPREACGIKIFLGSSTGNLCVDDPAAVEAVFAHAPILLAAHCEDDAVIAANSARMRSRYGEAVPMTEHPAIRSTDACLQSSARAVALARRHDTRLHILHLSTAAELDLLSDRPLEEKRITAEVCVHHLHFDESQYPQLGTRMKCNPAIKTAADRQALLQAICDGRIDVIGTDHAPHTLAEKQRPYFQAPSGLPLVQQALACLLEHYHEARLSLPQIVEKACHAPARLFDVQERGYLREGYWADLVLVDLNRPAVVDEATLLYRCGWSPFADVVFRSSIHATIVSGHLAYYNGRMNPEPAGRRLAFRR